MSRFNQQSEGTKTVNLAGGDAYSQSPDLELVSILLTSFANDQFYQSSNDKFDRLNQLILVCDPHFVAKALIYARTQFGMRSISHVGSSVLASRLSGAEWGKDFYAKVIHRPDDMMEIIAYHKSRGEKIPNAMIKGFRKAFDKFDGYQLAKYRGEGKAVKLVDVVNLVHPVPVEKNAEALDQLVKGTLKSTETWEAKMTQAGKEAQSDEEKAENKKKVWSDMLKSKKLGYMALVKNLRNIIEQSPDSVGLACENLQNDKAITKSLVLPFRLKTALDEVSKLSSRHTREVVMALSKAVDISCANVPKFPGETLVVMDTSGSMHGRPAEIGGLFAAVLVKGINADFMTFDTSAHYHAMNPMDSVLTLANSIPFRGGGTNFHTIFERANRKYDRVIILSDMMGWQAGITHPGESFNQYKIEYNANPFVYSFDLQGYGSMQFPENRVFCLAGFSEKVFDIMKLLEEDRNALINTIKNSVEL